MSSSNYIIIKDLKLVIKVSRKVDASFPYGEGSELLEQVNKLIEVMDNTSEELYSTLDKKYTELTLGDLTRLADIADKARVMTEFQNDYFLMLWLNANKIEYEINSEYSIDLTKLKSEGYNIIENG